ncbi:MAG: exodeoxyribonuclease VII small subunit [Clostridiales bacterium]|nr:exodeoxyribonuclease VII small subunit [Clostridiales bacterium]MBR6483532.1 exodeoxyribonuclease VII small subunit [Clostridiales bacterium]
MDEKKEFNVDQAMNELEEINKKLSQPDIELKESLELYKKGVTLANECREHLMGVEKELEIINSEEKS